MNYDLFYIIVASAISATAALPAQASVDISNSAVKMTQTYAPKYLQQSANLYVALDRKGGRVLIRCESIPWR
nr:hypothetical protein [uncultured Pseudomonas sp.]